MRMHVLICNNSNRFASLSRWRTSLSMSFVSVYFLSPSLGGQDRLEQSCCDHLREVFKCISHEVLLVRLKTLCRRISSFQQELREAISEAWERMQEYMVAYAHNGLDSYLEFLQRAARISLWSYWCYCYWSISWVNSHHDEGINWENSLQSRLNWRASSVT